MSESGLKGCLPLDLVVKKSHLTCTESNLNEFKI